MEKEIITLFAEEDILKEAEKILEKEGYTLSEAVELFLKKTIKLGNFPFNI